MKRFHNCFNPLEKDIEEPLPVEDLYFYENEVEVLEEPIDLDYYEEVEKAHEEEMKMIIKTEERR